jgi:hypothetical protein
VVELLNFGGVLTDDETIFLFICYTPFFDESTFVYRCVCVWFIALEFSCVHIPIYRTCVCLYPHVYLRLYLSLCL